jgi:mono/diheme cytochrome c family protein
MLECKITKTILGSAVLLWVSLSVGAQAQYPALGKELYDGRCLGCHKEAPYGKGPPTALTLEKLRSMAKLWGSISLGTLWTKQDLNDVVSYLNQKYYYY